MVSFRFVSKAASVLKSVAMRKRGLFAAIRESFCAASIACIGVAALWKSARSGSKYTFVLSSVQPSFFATFNAPPFKRAMVALGAPKQVRKS